MARLFCAPRPAPLAANSVLGAAERQRLARATPADDLHAARWFLRRVFIKVRGSRYCMALVHDPRNVILDEPTNGLDVMTTRGLREFLKQLRGEGRCVVFSSHIMQEVAALCDRIVIVARGEVVASGTADELRALTGEDNLEDAFVKAIGSEEGLHA